MAIDNRNKRASAIHIGLPWRGLLPAPDGVIGVADRYQLAFLYGGVAALVVPVLIEAGLTISSGISRTVAKTITAIIEAGALISKVAAKSVVAGCDLAIIVSKDIAKSITTGVKAAATIATNIGRLVIIIAGTAASASVSKAVGKSVSSAVTASASVMRTIAKAILAAVAVSVDVIATRAFIVVIEAVVGASASIGTIVRRILFRLGRFLGFGDSATRQHPQRGQITREGRGVGRDDELFD